MKKYLILGLLAAMFIVLVGVVLAAKPDSTPQSVIAEPSGGRAVIAIPTQAVEVAPGVFSLGIAVDNGRIVEGYAFVDYKKGFGKPSGCNNDGVCQGWEDSSCADCEGSGNGEDDSDCYGFLAKGAKWKTVESYMVDTSNTGGLNNAFIRSSLAVNIAKWETAAGVDILGDEISGIVDGADTESPDGKNEVMFGDIAEPNVIAVAILWGIWRGPPPFREIVEWDHVYDDVDFDWSATGEAGKMDFESISTHELGHSVGLDDLYKDECSEQTMYGYADYGETKKRTLEAGDITGIRELY